MTFARNGQDKSLSKAASGGSQGKCAGCGLKISLGRLGAGTAAWYVCRPASACVRKSPTRVHTKETIQDNTHFSRDPCFVYIHSI